MPFAWMPQDHENLTTLISRAVYSLKRQGISDIGESPTDLLILCAEYGEGRKGIQPCIAIGEGIENPFELEASITELAHEYFRRPEFGLEGKKFFFGVVEYLPDHPHYTRAIAGVVDREPTRRWFLDWLWGSL